MIVRKRGYLIFGSQQKSALGSIVRDFIDNRGNLCSHPFRVVRVTDRKDFLAQLDVIGAAHSDVDAWKYYHVVETD